MKSRPAECNPYGGAGPKLRLLPENNMQLPMVRCAPHSATLTIAACATRWARSQGKRKRSASAKRRGVEQQPGECGVCNVGRGHFLRCKNEGNLSADPTQGVMPGGYSAPGRWLNQPGSNTAIAVQLARVNGKVTAAELVKAAGCRASVASRTLCMLATKGRLVRVSRGVYGCPAEAP